MDIVLLLDRSPSMVARKYNGEPAVTKLATSLLRQFAGAVDFYGLEVHIEAVDFGEKLGAKIVMDGKSGDQAPFSYSVPISFTDFRPPLQYALSAFRRGKPCFVNRMCLVFMITDGEPWLQPRRMSEPEEKSYLSGEDLYTATNSVSPVQAIRSLEAWGAEVNILAVGDRQREMLLWQRVLGHGRYIRVSEGTNLLLETRRILQNKLEAPISLEPRPRVLSGGSTENMWSGYRGKMVRVWLPIGFGALALWSYLLWRRARLRRGSVSVSLAKVERMRSAAVELGKKVGKRDEANLALEAALTEGVSLARESGGTISEELREILSAMINHCADLEHERLRIVGLLSNEKPREIAWSLAPVIARRWILHPEILLEEYESFRVQPLGVELLRGFIEMKESPGSIDGEAGLYRGIRNLSKAAWDLRMAVGGGNEIT
ncbi:MAG: vWA domain-containing protein [Thermoanaerobaculia bacterium]